MVKTHGKYWGLNPKKLADIIRNLPIPTTRARLLYVGTSYGQQISSELQNKITVILVDPVHTDDVLLKHSLRETMIRNGQMNIQRARKAQDTILESAVQGGLDIEAPVKLVLLQIEIAQGEFSAKVEVPIVLNDSQKTQFSTEWRTYR
jgi:hypothetical protein